MTDVVMTDVRCPVILKRGKRAGQMCGGKNCYHRKKEKETSEKNILEESIRNRLSEESEKRKLKEIIVNMFLAQHQCRVSDIVAIYLREGGTLVDGTIIRPLFPNNTSIEVLRSMAKGEIPLNILI